MQFAEWYLEISKWRIIVVKGADGELPWIPPLLIVPLLEKKTV
ncbi:hypothetical protein AGR6A_pTi0136 [Agrobacterium sp. NCPPB 925]|nr:hypothetical protein AGR6A_pTi0136 [Agrobacterium sp. NCPPB 925]